MTCIHCHIEKEPSEFYPCNKRKSGINPVCKACESARSKEKNQRRRDKRLAVAKKWRTENKEKYNQSIKEWRERNPEKAASYYIDYRDRNRAKVNARWMERYAMKLQQTPNWLTEDQLSEIEAFYIEADKLTKTTGESYNVDHIIPLTSKIVSGLHVPWNLQVITATENRRKSNRLEIGA